MNTLLSRQSNYKFHKISFMMSICFLILTAVTALWLGSTKYDVLYADLNKSEANKIMTLLATKRVAFRTSFNNRTISIPRDSIVEWRKRIEDWQIAKNSH